MLKNKNSFLSTFWERMGGNFELMRCFSTLSSTFPFFLRCSCGWSSDFFILRQGWNSRRLHLFVLPSSHFYFCCGPDLSIRMPTSTHDLAPLRISLFHYKNDSRSRFFPLKMKIGVSFLGGRNLFGLRSAIHYEPPPINQTNTHGMLRINSRKTSCRWFDSIINIRCRWKKKVEIFTAEAMNSDWKLTQHSPQLTRWNDDAHCHSLPKGNKEQSS